MFSMTCSCLLVLRHSKFVCVLFGFLLLGFHWVSVVELVVSDLGKRIKPFDRSISRTGSFSSIENITMFLSCKIFFLHIPHISSYDFRASKGPSFKEKTILYIDAVVFSRFLKH